MRTWEAGVLLKVEAIHVFHGAFAALRDVSLEVNAGEVVAILGANGAGKSTLLKTISGLMRPSLGSILFNGTPIDKMPPDSIVRLGISHCPEGRMLFPEMPVYKNLELGAYVRKKDRRLVKRLGEEVYELFPILKERRRQTAGTLSGGEQQMLAMGRALMSGPQLLMLDEPSLGLAPIVLMDIMNALTRIRQSGTSILLVEQNAAESLRIADHGYVLETGNIVLAGKGCDLMADERIKQSYLGA
ncbi:MAG TPA: ABC transporter ATP-binding protein [Desulfatiglandales bacterium]|nr:ABC transporter ATP-binding protein [Desulfatiglandales bacterium]